MGQELTAADVMHTDVLTVSPKLPMLDLEKLLIEHRVGGVPVVEDGKIIGIISRSDVIRHLTEDQAADAIETEYHWDIGPPTTKRASGSGGSSADPAAVAEMLSKLEVSDLMVKDVVAVRADAAVSEVASLMAERHIHRVVVTNDGELLGVITTLDLTRLLADGRARAER